MHKTELDEWIEFTRAWLDEETRKQREVDEAAWLRFRAKVLGPFD
jgi:hypothetical protein